MTISFSISPRDRIRALTTLLATLMLLAPGRLVAQDGAFPLEGLVITASPTPRSVEAVASHVTILSADDLRDHGDRTVAEALRDVAGLDVVRSGSFGAAASVFLRGGESDYTLVLVDGVQVNQAGGGFDFSTLTTDNVERIEIVRGPASALYGSDAVTGVIHVVTRTGRGGPRAGIGLQAGAFGRRDVSLDLAAGTASAGYTIALGRRASDGILPFNNQHLSTVLSGRARLAPDDHTEVGLTLRWTEHDFHFPTDGAGAVVDRNAYSFDDATTIQATVTRALTDRLSLQALVGVNDVDTGTDDRPDGPADTLGFYGFTSLDRFRRASGELRAHLLVGEAVVTGGFEAERESQRSFSESESEFGPSVGRSASERSNRAGFVHLSGEAGPLSLTAGGRLEDNERFGRFLTWQAGVSWRVPGALGVRMRAAAGSAIKEPTFFENYATGFATGNPDLDPEHADSWEVGLERRWWSERVEVRATYFDQRFEDLIQYTFTPPTPSGPNYFNVAAARARGAEVDASLTVEDVSFGVSHASLDTQVTDAGFDGGAGATFVEGERLLRRPRSTWSVRASAAASAALRVHARLSVVGARSDRDFTTFPATPVTLPAYESLAAGVEWTAPRGFGLDLTLSARGENLLAAEYEEVLGFPAPGRAVYVGARVGLGGPPR
jgi:vitamin B12 transporter